MQLYVPHVGTNGADVLWRPYTVVLVPTQLAAWKNAWAPEIMSGGHVPELDRY